MDQKVVAENDAARARLNALVAKLKDSDYERQVGRDWTVGTALAHLAYWDRRNRLLLEAWKRGNVPPDDGPEWYDDAQSDAVLDVQNDALLDEWRALSPQAVARLVSEAAAAADATVTKLDDGLADKVIAAGGIRRLARSQHRSEHIADIEKALGR